MRIHSYMDEYENTQRNRLLVRTPRQVTEAACKAKCAESDACKFVVWKQNKKDDPTLGGCTQFETCIHQKTQTELKFKVWKKV